MLRGDTFDTIAQNVCGLLFSKRSKTSVCESNNFVIM